MEFDNSFTVEKPIDEVWSTMVDLERVVPCVPGATILEQTSDQAVKAEVKIKLGAMSMNYSGPAEIVEQVTPHELRGVGTCDRDRPLEALAPFVVLGPDKGGQPAHGVLVGDVERIEVDAAAPGDRRRMIGQRRVA